MKTRKQVERENAVLRERIKELNISLDTERAFNKAIKEASEKGMLPVKGAECTGCKHAFIYVANSSALAVACRKDVDCKEFEPREKPEIEYAGILSDKQTLYNRQNVGEVSQY